MTTTIDAAATGDAVTGVLPGVAVTSLTPDDLTAVTAAMLIAMLAHDGANVAAMVPVETGLDAPCDAGSRGSLIRWAAGHLDDPRFVTPFALEADRSAMHAADAAGTLLHGAAFERAREALCEGRTTFVVVDAVGLLDPITTSLTMLDLLARWGLDVLLVEPASRWAVGHVRLLASVVQARGLRVTGVVLTDHETTATPDADARAAMQETISALLGCPVVHLPHVPSFHDRGELLTAARACGLHRVLRSVT